MNKSTMYSRSTHICLKAQKVEVQVQNKSYAVEINGTLIYRIMQYRNAKLGSK